MKERSGYVICPEQRMNNSWIGQSVTSRSKSNLALSFFCLPREQKWAMTVFYAFCRVIDDIVDSTMLSPQEKKEGIFFWKKEIERIYTSMPSSPLGKELREVVIKWNLPQDILQEIILGVEMDITQSRYKTFEELSLYCYRVAGAVGLISIEIFGCSHSFSREYALTLGKAFQLTNILRDVPKDSAYGRIYFPLEELEEHGISEKELLDLKWSLKIREFFRFQYLRAKHYFAKSSKLIHPSDRPKLLAAEIMSAVYRAILEKIRAKQFNVFHHSIRLSKSQKLASIFKVLVTNFFDRRGEHSFSPPKKIVVLGGGFAGLSAAIELNNLGHDVVLLESKSMLGGRAGSFKHPRVGETIDTGQHVMMGCYHHTLELIEKLGGCSKLFWIDPIKIAFFSNKNYSVLAAGQLPAPLHLLVALLRYSQLNFGDWVRASTFLLSLLLADKPHEQETASQWLKRKNQSPSLIRSLWEPLCVAALNLPLEEAAALLFYEVVRKTLLGKRKDLSLVLSRVGLGDLFSKECERLLKMCGSNVYLKSAVCSMEFENGHLKAVRTTEGKMFSGDCFISALPWHTLGSLLPEKSPLKEQCRSLKQSPILSLYFWVDRPLTNEPVIGFLDSPVQWLFARNLFVDSSLLSFPLYSYVAVISAPPQDILSLSSKEIENMVWKEINRLIPSSKEARFCQGFLFKAIGATPKFDPESLKHRPGPATQWKNFFLAGDWTATGLPATIEGAILSGKTAAQHADSLPLTEASPTISFEENNSEIPLKKIPL
ncbi:hydroxysqualene dehydroxylase HpnE [Candidatus Methylacidiphilum infernorum]|uniref:Phytoene/squalene synthetase fused to flavin containing amine oxidoreductase n=1 Tax=Methylacidiphilum infernorum (isolate V4) TaxID=481448 RepID=B3DZS6_METI4|nr:hydroxysqualene dehydroxylase HpnE [Candidatus Methylacidiphilum infernorum]ACD84261.1 Phytoene/squalene synthetase fused to flavin containing amine oxidoreductase [Methylacidiphilum infernorum V4]